MNSKHVNSFNPSFVLQSFAVLKLLFQLCSVCCRVIKSSWSSASLKILFSFSSYLLSSFFFFLCMCGCVYSDESIWWTHCGSISAWLWVHPSPNNNVGNYITKSINEWYLTNFEEKLEIIYNTWILDIARMLKAKRSRRKIFPRIFYEWQSHKTKCWMNLHFERDS